MPSTIEYTDQQAEAIKARKVSLALDAGAGCGKTFVLTERFLKELETPEGLEPDVRLSQLVAITFTDAAARELRTRIRRLVAERIASVNSTERTYWIQLQRAIDGCRISTIHSLCGNLLRSHAFDVGLDPTFATLDSPASQVLQTAAVEDTLRELLAARDTDAMLLGRAWNVDRTKQYVRSMLDHYRKPGFVQWLAQEPADLLEAWQAFFTDHIWPTAAEELTSLASRMLMLLDQFTPQTASATEIHRELSTALTSLTDGAPTSSDLTVINELARVRTERNAPRKIPFLKGGWERVDQYEDFKQEATQLREALKRLPIVDFGSESAQIAAELGLALARVAGRAAECYEQMKTGRAALDYDDLIATAHRLLSDPKHQDIQSQLQASIDVLFVDEFQDTDRIQVEMVKALVGDLVESGKLFFVGDGKQSIYRFRGAEPQVFRDLQQEIEPAWRLPLTHNFRSQPAILNFVNAVFAPVFEEYKPLRPSRPQVSAEPAIELLWTKFPELSRGKAGSVAAARRAEARTIASRLRTLIDSKAPIVGDAEAIEGRRAVEYGDVTLLFRSLSDVAAYEEALRQQEIPYYLVGGHAFYTQQEIYDVLHLLRVVMSECDELSLAGVLRSPFFSLPDETLFWLTEAHNSLERGLFAPQLTSNIDVEEQAKVRRAAETISMLRTHKEEWTPPKLLAEAMERTGYDAALLAEFMGERKLANVYKLMEQARNAVASSVGSLADFVTQLAEFTTTTPKEALATTSPGTANVVRLMTVHKSKGLEFPVVIIPDLDRKANASSDQVVFDNQLGPLVAPPSDGGTDSSGLKLFKHLDKLADQAETDRLFYVACTRAADYLLLSSAMDDPSEPKGPWSKRLGEVVDLATGELLDPSGLDEAEWPVIAATIAEAPEAKPFASGKAPEWLKLLQSANRQSADNEIERMAAPHPVDPMARRRFSVTRLSGQIIPSGGDWWRSDPEAEERDESKLDYNPLGFGTLVHAMLERADLDNPASISQWSHSLAPYHDLLHADSVTPMAEELVARFAKSPRAAELRAADQVCHELEFLLTWPLGSTSANSRFLQGYIDCLYQSADGGWRVVDYKTNQVSAAGVPALAAKYELQMFVYGLAVEQTWGAGPKELVLHFLRPGIEYTFEWNAAARSRAIQMVENALESLASNASAQQ